MKTKHPHISSQDYSPFGVTLRGRSWSDGYRYGFNGKELDNEGVGGGGNTYDYGFRIYNPALAKFLSVDPLCASYPWYTPYQFAGNEPILCVDLEGLERIAYHIKQEKVICHLIQSSTLLSEIYGRVTIPEKQITVHVGKISRSAYGGSLGFGAVTFPDDQLRAMANLIIQVDEVLKYNETYPQNKQEISDEILEKYEKSKAVLDGINLTPKEVISSKDKLYAILINSEDLKKMESNTSESQIRVINNFIHEIDAHLEELILGSGTSKDDVINQHGKYFGFDREKYQSGDQDQINLYQKITKGISPSPGDYIKGSEADKVYNAIQEAVNNSNQN